MYLERQLHVNGNTLNYQLALSKRRRTLALTIKQGLLIVRCPWGTPAKTIESAIHGHMPWITEHLHKSQQMEIAQGVAEGDTIWWQGEMFMLKVSADRKSIHWHEQSIVLPNTDRSTKLFLLEQEFKRKALPLYQARAEAFSALLQVTVPTITLTKAKTRWGSCSRTGIRLHWRLVQLPPTVCDYVIAHECAHLLEMNHSSRFWQHVARIYPDWQQARQALRQWELQLPQWQI